MTLDQVRAAFINYFKKNGHSIVASSRLIPDNDPTLLFNNAGMNQFKNVFLGLEKRDYKRAVSSQKCVRAGGKHNDLENVGHTARHHTFFEMLGNFSFGDYFKKEAIRFAWEFVTKELSLPKDRLYVSVYQEDDEAADIWHKQEGVAKDRIYRFGQKDNFWRMGETGPCGPCSEIFYDMGPEVGGNPKDNVVGGEGDRYIEFWNLVFMQFYEDGKTTTKLPNPSIDTGSGLERLSAIMQGEISNYHTDAFRVLLKRISEVSKKDYHFDLKKIKESERATFDAQNVAFRVLSDHARATAFLMADGVLPSNEGRGYVLRRIMRRAIRFGRNLSETTSILPSVVETVIDSMKGAYPELEQQRRLILTNTRDEETRFLTTLDQGTQILSDELKKLNRSGSTTLGGEVAFKLYDTYGFPLDLTRLIAEEQNYAVDERGFEEHLDRAREKAKASWKGKSLSANAAHVIKVTQDLKTKNGATEFVGYNGTLQAQGKILLLSDGTQEVKELKADQTGFMIFDKTCFYAESGGQVGDSGTIHGTHGQAEVLDCQKQNDIHVHHVKVVDGSFKVNEVCALKVTESKRRATANNHSATHLLHAALRQVLGPHVTQAGSLVEADRLRFDFTHNKPLTREEILRLEGLVNDEIARSNQVGTQVMTPKAAIEAGALALFGEKYGDEVRVVKMGEFSMELCGGTHVDNTAMIRLFKIVSEGGVSAGVRRIEAITGDLAVRYVMKNTQENLAAREAAGLRNNWMDYLDRSEVEMPLWIDSQKNEAKNLQKAIQGLQGQQVDVNQLLSSAKTFSANGQDSKLILADIDMSDRKVLSEVSDRLRDKVSSGIVVIVGKGENTDSHPIIVSVSKNLVGPYNAGQILKNIAEEMGGKGGGRPDFAQGAGLDRSKLPSAFKKTSQQILGA